MHQIQFQLGSLRRSHRLPSWREGAGCFGRQSSALPFGPQSWLWSSENFFKNNPEFQFINAMDVRLV